MTTFLSALIVLASIGLIAVVILSEPSQGGMGAITGGSESFWDSNKGKSKEAMLNKLAIVCSIVFAVSLLIIAKI